MQNLRLILKNSLKSRLFFSISIFSVLLVVILLCCTGTVLMEKFVKMESKSSYRQLDYIAQQLETYLESVDNYSKALLVDPNIQSAVYKYNKMRDEFTGIDQIDIRQNISQIIQSIPYIQSVSIYNPEYELIVSSSIYINQNTQIRGKGTEHPVWYSGTQYSTKNKNETIPVLSLLRPIYHISTGALLGYMDISIPEYDIASIYKEHTSKSNHIFFIDKNGIIKSSDKTISIGEPYLTKNSFSNSSDHAYLIKGDTILFSTSFPPLDWYLINEYQLNEFFQPIYMVLVISLVIGIICVILSLFISRKLSYTITSPLYHLVAHIRKVKEGIWTPVSITYDDSDIGMLFTEFNSMILAQEHLKDDLLQTQKMKNQVSLDLLQQQVNPHFLYNTLDNIYSLAELDHKETLKDLVMNLSTFYRKSLSQGKFHITIGEELEITRSYLQIMQIRYHNKFCFTITCPPSLLRCKCLKLLLQPIVENSIYHGIKELDQAGMLWITVSEISDETAIQLTIKDNGVGFSEHTLKQIWNADSTHFGVKNIHERIQLYYGKEYGLSIDSPLGGGCLITLKIKREEILK